MESKNLTTTCWLNCNITTTWVISNECENFTEKKPTAKEKYQAFLDSKYKGKRNG